MRCQVSNLLSTVCSRHFLLAVRTRCVQHSRHGLQGASDAPREAGSPRRGYQGVSDRPHDERRASSTCPGPGTWCAPACKLCACPASCTCSLLFPLPLPAAAIPCSPDACQTPGCCHLTYTASQRPLRPQHVPRRRHHHRPRLRCSKLKLERVLLPPRHRRHRKWQPRLLVLVLVLVQEASPPPPPPQQIDGQQRVGMESPFWRKRMSAVGWGQD